MTAQTRSRRTLQARAPRGAAVTWVSRGMHVGSARQRQGWAGAAQGAHGSRQGTKCSQRRHDRTEPVRGYQPIEVRTLHIGLSTYYTVSLREEKDGPGKGVARHNAALKHTSSISLSIPQFFCIKWDRCSGLTRDGLKDILNGQGKNSTWGSQKMHILNGPWTQSRRVLLIYRYINWPSRVHAVGEAMPLGRSLGFRPQRGREGGREMD